MKITLKIIIILIASFVFSYCLYLLTWEESKEVCIDTRNPQSGYVDCITGELIKEE